MLDYTFERVWEKIDGDNKSTKVWKDQFLETTAAKEVAPQKEQEKKTVVGQNVVFCLKDGSSAIKGRVAAINENFIMLDVGESKFSFRRDKGNITLLPENEKSKEAIIPEKSRRKSHERSFSMVD